MKRCWLAVMGLLMVLCLSAPAHATPNLCAMTGNLQEIYGAAAASTKVNYKGINTQNPSSGSGYVIPGQSSCSVTTDSSGNLPTTGNCTSFIQGVKMYVTVGYGPPTLVQVPIAASVDLSTLIMANTDPPSLVTDVQSANGNCTVTNPGTGSLGTATINCSIPTPTPSGTGIDCTASPYNADATGVADSTSAINSCIQAAVAAKQPAFLEGGTYKVTQINATNLNGLDFGGTGAINTANAGTPPTVINCQEAVANTGICFDASGLSYSRIHDLAIFGATSSGNAPKVALLGAKLASGTNANGSFDTFERVEVATKGPYGFYDYGMENLTCIDCVFKGTSTSGSTPITFSAVNSASISSPFQTLKTAPVSMTIVTMLGSNGYVSCGSGENCMVLDEGNGTTNGQIQLINLIGEYFQNVDTPAVADNAAATSSSYIDQLNFVGVDAECTTAGNDCPGIKMAGASQHRGWNIDMHDSDVGGNPSTAQFQFGELQASTLNLFSDNSAPTVWVTCTNTAQLNSIHLSGGIGASKTNISCPNYILAGAPSGNGQQYLLSGNALVNDPVTVTSSGAAQTADFTQSSNYNYRELTANLTITLSGNAYFEHETVKVCQNFSGSGPFTVTWVGASSATIIWSGNATPLMTQASGGCDIAKFIYDVNNNIYYGAYFPAARERGSAPSLIQGPAHDGVCGAGCSVDFSDGDYIKLEMTASATVTLSNCSSAHGKILELYQDASGGWTPTFATDTSCGGGGGVKWSGGSAPTPTTTAGKADLYGFAFDGTNLHETGFIPNEAP